MVGRIPLEREANDSSMSRNAAAYSGLRARRNTGSRNRSGARDSKHIDAAALALNLASENSWSDLISPSVPPKQENTNENLRSTQELDSSRNQVMTDDSDLGPPPAYSSSLPQATNTDLADVEPDNMRRPSVQQEPASPGGDLEQSADEDNADGPLLGESNEKLTGPWYPRMGTNNNAGPRQHHRWRLCATIGLIVMIAFGSVLGSLYAGRLTFSPRRTLPLVSTQRIHIQHESHRDIRGRFELYDRLELSTTVGSIDIEIDPQPGNGTAKLVLSSSMGAIRLGVSDSWMFRRERSLRPIHTEIKTVEGSVYGRLLLGNGGIASIDSVTGAQDLRVYVYKADTEDKLSELTTRSHIGKQVVALVNFGGWEAKISNLLAKHHSLGTADLDLQYSHAWRGQVHAVSSAVGHVEVQGDVGLVFDKKDEHEVLAHKGKGSQREMVDVVSGGTGSVCFKSWYTW